MSVNVKIVMDYSALDLSIQLAITAPVDESLTGKARKMREFLRLPVGRYLVDHAKIENRKVNRLLQSRLRALRRRGIVRYSPGQNGWVLV